MPTPSVAVVTDSTAMLSTELAAELGITVVPLQVVVDADAHDEGSDEATPSRIAKALKEHQTVSTSRPSPALLLEAYEAAAASGAHAVVSVHLSAEMSGTFESAQLAARTSPVPVLPVDTRQVGVATGYGAISAAEVARAGGTADDVATAARRRASKCTSLFYVDTLEYLRRGGRIGAAAAIVGGALAVKPLLTIDNGRVTTLEKVRTSSRAMTRLEDLAVLAAEGLDVDLCVAHLAGGDRASALAERLADRLEDELDGREVWCDELGAVLGAHVGPGMVAVCVAPRLG
jgi:DegV family protein with EDD domain